MSGLFNSWPYPLAVVGLALIGYLRARLTYVAGRAVGVGAERTRLRRLVESPGFRRAGDALNRWGPPVVSISFLTVGFQTLVNLAAGVCRMPPKRYVPALAVGAVMWGFLYATVGFVTFAAWYRLYQRQPIVALVILALLLITVISFVVYQVRAGRAGSAAERVAEGER